MMTGRQILLMIYEHFRVTEVDNNILGVEDLIAVKKWSVTTCGVSTTNGR